MAVLVFEGGLVAQRGPADVEWRHYSGDNGSTKYSPLAQITKDNITRLRIAWRRPQLDPALLEQNPKLRPANNFRSTPIMVGGVLYASNGIGLVEAFDPATGRTIWVQQVPASELPVGSANRGVAYWSQGANGRILTFRNQYLYALDARTGEPVAEFGTGGRVDLTAATGAARAYSWNGTPLVVRDVVVLGSSMAEQDSAARMTGVSGDVYGFDVRTGQLRWTFRPIPRAGEPGIETWENESWRYTGAANVWAPMSGDDELGYVYLPTSSATNDMYGGHRLGANLFSSSIVCLDAATGKRVWHFQTVHHDLFDYDNPAAPILADITVDGRRIKAVVQVTKQAFAFVLDRVTGQPVWPIEERPVPASTVPGERASLTQPVPSKPPAFDRQGLTVDDLIDFTPAASGGGHRDHQAVRDRSGVHAAIDRRPWARGQEGHDPDAGFGRRRGLDRGGVRSRDGDAVRAVDDEPVRGEPAARRSGAHGPPLPGQHAPVDSGAAGPAVDQAAIRPHHRVEPESRRAGLDGGQRRRPAQSSAAQAVATCRRSARRFARRRWSPRPCCS